MLLRALGALPLHRRHLLVLGMAVVLGASAPQPQWVGPLPGTYEDTVCANVGIRVVGLAACETACDHFAACTAVNWGPDPTGKTPGGCVLRACKTSAAREHPTGGVIHGIHGYYCNGSATNPCSQPGPTPKPHPDLGDVFFPLHVGAVAGRRVVTAAVPWRRRDLLPGPLAGEIAVTCPNSSATTYVLASDAVILNRSRTHAHVAFAPSCGAGSYKLWYLLPGTSTPLPSPCAASAPCPSCATLALCNGGCCSPGTNATLRGFREGDTLNGASSAFAAAATRAAPADVVVASVGNKTATSPYFGSHTEMEEVASDSELKAMLDDLARGAAAAAAGGAAAPSPGLLIFPEDAAHEVRMFDFLPLRWAQRGPQSSLWLTAQPNEYVSFQLGLWNPPTAMGGVNVTNITVAFAPDDPSALPLSAFRCTSCGGLDHHGQPFSKTQGEMSLMPGRVLPLWLGLMVPVDAASGSTASILTANLTLTYHHTTQQPAVSTGDDAQQQQQLQQLQQQQEVRLSIGVPAGAQVLADHGDQDMRRRSRLRWLDSDRAIDDKPALPYTPIEVTQTAAGVEYAAATLPVTAVDENDKGSSDAEDVESNQKSAGGRGGLLLKFLGRSVSIGACGLPTNITSWGVQLLAAPIAFGIDSTSAAASNAWHPLPGGVVTTTKRSSGIVQWEANCSNSGSVVGTGGRVGVAEPEDGLGLLMWVRGTLEAEGFLDFTVSLTNTNASASSKSVHINADEANDGTLRGADAMAAADQAIKLRNVTLSLDFVESKRSSSMMMGWGLLATKRAPLEWAWNKNLPKRNSMLWVGGGEAGLRLSLKGPEKHWSDPMWYGWPSMKSGYNMHKLEEVPRSWGGDDKSGGCAMSNSTARSGGQVPLRCWSNTLTLAAGETVDFHFDVLVTPFQDLNTRVKERVNTRHYQLGYGTSIYGPPQTEVPPTKIAQTYGSNTIGLHQGTGLNMFISWIFDPVAQQNTSRYISAAHEAGMRVKTYFTVRELTVRSAMSELFAIASFGDEIIDTRLSFPDPWERRNNLGNFWMQEHLLGRLPPNASYGGNISAAAAALINEPGYSIAWNQEMPWNPAGWRWDYAVHVRGTSRWSNWYVEALHWACTKGMTSPPDNVTIDGLYLDGFNWDRVTAKRVRKVLDRTSTSERRPKKTIDFHCMQTYDNPYGEYGRTSVSLNFMQHLPFIDNLWFGEGFNTGPSVSKEHWLVEQSGVLFGMFSEMLAGPNLWKGMLFLETGRAPAVNMAPLYKVWDEHHLEEMSICGWWNSSGSGCQATTSDSETVPLTVYHCDDCGDGGKPAALFAIASFAPSGVTNVTVNADWVRLGFQAKGSSVDSRAGSGNHVELQAPAIAGFQVSRTFALSEPIPVVASAGLVAGGDSAVAAKSALSTAGLVACGGSAVAAKKYIFHRTPYRLVLETMVAGASALLCALRYSL